MRNLITLALVAATLPMMAANTTTSVKTSATAPVKVKIVAPCHIETTGTLDFGTVMMNEYYQDGAVGILPKTTAGGTSQVAAAGVFNCVNMASTQSVAEFHYRHDATMPVTVTIDGNVIKPATGDIINHVTDHKVHMSNGLYLMPATDLPSDSCGLFTPIAGVADRHFGLGGVLFIPKTTFGAQTGSVTVTIAYL